MLSEKEKQLNILIEVAHELSSGKKFPELFQSVINIVCASSGADGGTLYMHDNKYNTLKAVLLTNQVLDIHSVVSEFDPLAVSGFIEVPLQEGDSTQSAKISASAFLQRQTIAVPDINAESRFDFSGVKAFDESNNYQTRSLIAFPLHATSDDTPIGVLQVINPDPKCFEDDYLRFLNTLAGHITISLNNALLIKEGQNLLGAIVRMVGMAIDEKSPHTSGHCYRVTEVTMMLADAVEQEMVDFEMSTSDREALKMAALLHDVGKIITPDHILEKPTKLFTLTDRIEHLIDRLHMWRISEELDALKKNVIAAGRKDLLPSSKESDVSQLNSDIDLLKEVNTGNLFMDEEVMNKLENISSRVIAHTQPPTEKNDEQDGREKVVARKDLSDLQILRGTLNPRERKIMEEHASITIRLLSSIPWPKKYSRVVEYAGNHHEKMNGAGYPNRLSASELSIPSRILGIADRFEGLSAPDRPYRSRKMTLSRVLDIMQSMSDEGEIDADLYRIFLKSKIHLKYGHQFLDNALVDCA